MGRGQEEATRLARGLPFDAAVLLFDRPVLATVDDRFDYGETRLRAIGEVAGLILVCAYTETSEVRRVISLRRASRRERDAYRTTHQG
ncbi:MAG TPA: BrnT family toxin [Caulobacteraceae bacterium]|nr:BrnT family toxin [Caulobacteraceae bacterium]